MALCFLLKPSRCLLMASLRFFQLVLSFITFSREFGKMSLGDFTRLAEFLELFLQLGPFSSSLLFLPSNFFLKGLTLLPKG